MPTVRNDCGVMKRTSTPISRSAAAVIVRV
jgi:hypothetical protein